jgi:uncharacterized membrane protein
MAKNDQTPAVSTSSRLERILSFMAIGLVSTAVLTMLVTLIVTFVHRSSGDSSALTLPGWVSVYPFLGLTVGALCIIGVVVSSILRRSRANR